MIQTILFIVSMIALGSLVFNTAFGSRYHTECHIDPSIDIDFLKGFFVVQNGGTNTLKWQDRDAAEVFNCIKAIEIQEKLGINKPVN